MKLYRESDFLASAQHLGFFGSAESPTILQWWAERAAAFSLISPVARVLLAVPATSAPSERVFSFAGLVSSGRRASISPQVLQAYVREGLSARGKRRTPTTFGVLDEEGEGEEEDEL